MNILMCSNTFTPHVGGVSRSVQSFTKALRELGHRVMVVAPEFPDTPEGEEEVIRIPAIQNFNGSDFCVRLPIPAILFSELREFKADVIHSHHPFLLGDTALRLAALWQVPLVFTHHTMYEQYTHYVPGDSPALQQFAISLATGYANLCNRVIAPSESVQKIISSRGVETPISVVPTGINLQTFAAGNGQKFRRKFNIPDNTFVIGHVGRLAPEKNLDFLLSSVIEFMQRGDKTSVFVVVGSGPAEQSIKDTFKKHRLQKRLVLAGTQQGEDLISAFSAFNVFVFSSTSETQGMVLAEALAASVPLVALEANGVREVLQDGVNGYLVTEPSTSLFADSIERVVKANKSDYQKLVDGAKSTVREFSEEVSAKKLETVYKEVTQLPSTEHDLEENAWAKTLRLIDNEYELLSRNADAARKSLLRLSFFKWRVIVMLRAFFRRTRMMMSSTSWTLRLLNIHSDVSSEPGLIMIQIDGLSRRELERALDSRKMKFLRRLLNRENYHLHNLYSGLPSTTPACQAELFYGMKTIVPAFAYFRDGKAPMVRMYEPENAAAVEALLAADAEGLLTGGASYCNIYSGGASECTVCPAAFGWNNFVKGISLFKRLLLVLLHVDSVLRTLALSIVEIFIALYDALKGSLRGHPIGNEFRFALTRVLACIVSREVVTESVRIDIERGLPIIYLNFVGYDEQSHRRGPDSAFAHWTLKGIDGAIQKIWKSARNTRARDYDVWILSDHGQESVTPYPLITGKTLQQTLSEVIGGSAKGSGEKLNKKNYPESSEGQRVLWFSGVFSKLLKPRAPEGVDVENGFKVAAIGPLALIYFDKVLESTEKRQLAKKIVSECQVPMALWQEEDQQFFAYNKTGVYSLPEDTHKVVGDDHPFLSEIGADLVGLLSNSNAGQIILSGWNGGAQPNISFPVENGAHAGPGSVETNAFALTPVSATSLFTGQRVLRHKDVRQAALEHLHRATPDSAMVFDHPLRPVAGRIRIMTYNVHSCIGTDDRLSPERIARVIAQYCPDIVALQELDVIRARTKGVDQARVIANFLKMEFHFHPALSMQEEKYGDAVLSRFPMKLVKADGLPDIKVRGGALEPRGALWVRCEVAPGVSIDLINTHLGLLTAERQAQADELLGERWLKSIPDSSPTIFCGDLNALPYSRVYRSFSAKFVDCQRTSGILRARKTWPSRYPVSRIDHVFVNDKLKVHQVMVPKTDLTMIASDHLPLIVDLEVAVG